MSDILGIKDKYPSNNGTNKSKKENKPVVTGKVTMEKEPLGKRIKETFFQESGQNVKKYIIFSVLVPGIADLLYESVCSGLNLLFHGNVIDKRRSTNIYGGRNYSSIYGGGSNITSLVNKVTGITKDTTIIADPTYGTPTDRITFHDRRDVDIVIDRLVEQLQDYGSVSIGDFFDFASVSCDISPTDWHRGWTDLSGVDIRKARGGGWHILMPPVKNI